MPPSIPPPEPIDLNPNRSPTVYQDISIPTELRFFFNGMANTLARNMIIVDHLCLAVNPNCDEATGQRHFLDVIAMRYKAEICKELARHLSATREKLLELTGVLQDGGTDEERAKLLELFDGALKEVIGVIRKLILNSR